MNVVNQFFFFWCVIQGKYNNSISAITIVYVEQQMSFNQLLIFKYKSRGVSNTSLVYVV